MSVIRLTTEHNENIFSMYRLATPEPNSQFAALTVTETRAMTFTIEVLTCDMHVADYVNFPGTWISCGGRWNLSLNF